MAARTDKEALRVWGRLFTRDGTAVTEECEVDHPGEGTDRDAYPRSNKRAPGSIPPAFALPPPTGAGRGGPCFFSRRSPPPPPPASRPPPPASRPGPPVLRVLYDAACTRVKTTA